MAPPTNTQTHFLVTFSVAGLPPGAQLVLEWNGRCAPAMCTLGHRAAPSLGVLATVPASPLVAPTRRTQDRQFIDVHLREEHFGLLPSLRLELRPAADTAPKEVAKCMIGHVYVYSSPHPFDGSERVAAFPVRLDPPSVAPHRRALTRTPPPLPSPSSPLRYLTPTATPSGTAPPTGTRCCAT